MASTESPAVARRRLRLALRKARDAKGYTQGQVADALDWSLSKIQRIEGGESTISGTDLAALLRQLEVTDPAVVAELTEDGRASRRRDGDARTRNHLTTALAQLLQFETEATMIRCFQPTLVPGILQTRTYGSAIMDRWGDHLSADDREVRLDVRLGRWQNIFNRQNPPQYLLLLDESVLLREVGGPRGMAEQLQLLLDVTRQPQVLLRVVPLATPGGVGIVGPFTIFDLDDEENAVLYRESHLRDEIIQAPEEVIPYRQTFEQLWSDSLSMDASVRLITARLAQRLSDFDRSG